MTRAAIRDAADNLPQHEPMARHRVPKMRQTDRRFHHYPKENR